jgi:hypothetical protein
MNHEENSEEFEGYYSTQRDEVLESLEIDISDLSDYKLRESTGIRGTWESVIDLDPQIKHPINEIDLILGKNDHEMEAHIAGEDYLEVSSGELRRPGTLQLRISQTQDQLQSIENPFFQSITDTGTRYRVEETPVAFELGPLFDEAIGLDTGTDYLDIKAPTFEAFFEDHYSEVLEHHRDQYGEIELKDLFGTSDQY